MTRNATDREGAAIESSLGSVQAHIFLAQLDHEPLHKFISSASLYTRYLDDMFVICDSATKTNQLLSAFDIAHPPVKFTIEVENDSFLSYSFEWGASIERNVFCKCA